MTPAERQRRYRERKAAGLKAYKVYLDQYQVQALIDARMIDEHALDNPDVFADQLGVGIELALSKRDA